MQNNNNKKEHMRTENPLRIVPFLQLTHADSLQLLGFGKDRSAMELPGKTKTWKELSSGE